MDYQYKQEPLHDDEANLRVNACETIKERLVIWTLLDTGIAIGELAGLERQFRLGTLTGVPLPEAKRLSDAYDERLTQRRPVA